ncbi:MAG: C39 family peptidase [Candidatus Sungbacteria bacterium]|nr:C39 family peptidase [Candidatus Sungbacteria bacterium]
MLLGVAMDRFANNRVSGVIIFSTIAAVSFFVYPAFWGENSTDKKISAEQQPKVPVPSQNAAVLPEKLLLDVPFSSQAPYGNWDQPWQDACEETSVLMAVAWARGFELTPAFAAEEILKQVQFEERVFGYHRDTNLEDTGRLINGFYRYQNFEIRYDNVTVENIKKELTLGNLVIVPLAGELLENPYFTSPPHYHMAVIRGYDEATSEFIVNEPGTKFGNAFRYGYNNIMEATHDWTGSPASVEQGRKGMIIVHPILKR